LFYVCIIIALRMEVKETNYKRFIASEGKALKWSEEHWNYNSRSKFIAERCSPYDALIDVNALVGEVVEIPFEEYEKEAKYYGLSGNRFV